MRSKELRGNLLLLLTAVIWGSAFVAQSAGMDHLGPFTFQAMRSFLGALALVPVILFSGRKHKAQAALEATGLATGGKQLWLGGLACGAALTLGSSLQQIGIQYTTVGKAGFITALYILFVPILGLFAGKRVDPRLWLCVGIAVVGLYLLCMTDGFSLSQGDIYVGLCALAFSLHILVVDYFAARVEGVRLSCLQFLFCGIFSSILMMLTEQPRLQNIFAAWLPILYAGLLSSGVGYTLQVVAQKDTRPAVASLIMSLESVFAVLAGILVLGQVPTLREAIGCVLMFGAIILAQLPGKQKKSN